MDSRTEIPREPDSASRGSPLCHSIPKRGHSPATPRYASGAAAAVRKSPYFDLRLMPYATNAAAVARLAQRSNPLSKMSLVAARDRRNSMCIGRLLPCSGTERCGQHVSFHRERDDLNVDQEDP